MSEGTCANCGKPFTAKVRKPFLSNLTLFDGGAETVCKACVKRLEKNSAERLREIKAARAANA